MSNSSINLCLDKEEIATVKADIKKCVLPIIVFLFSRNEYLIFQKIIKLEYEFPEKFFPKAKELVRQLLVCYCHISTDKLDTFYEFICIRFG